jgi:hypothetical protein
MNKIIFSILVLAIIMVSGCELVQENPQLSMQMKMEAPIGEIGVLNGGMSYGCVGNHSCSGSCGLGYSTCSGGCYCSAYKGPSMHRS